MLKTIAAFDRIGEENAFAVLARANALQAQGRDIISLGIGQPDFRTPDFIVEAAIKALRDGHHGYTPANGIPQLREAVAADLHKRFKVEVSPDSVMIMPGGKPTMFMSILMFGEPGVDILYPDPGFPIYRSMIEYTGARPIPVPIREENGFAFSADETLKLITPQTRLLIINSPANPTGGVTPKAEIDKLVAGLEKFPDVCIMSDEIYDQILYDHAPFQPVAPLAGDHPCLTFSGLSKVHRACGWRVGWAHLSGDDARLGEFRAALDLLGATDWDLPTIDELNANPECTGYIVQLPLPKHLDENAALERAEFVIVQEAYAGTETLAYADLVLPATREVQMRVGALPLYPTNALRYNVTWSVDGLINEYCNPCEIVFDGHALHRASTHQLVDFGIGRTFQIVRPFPALSVEDNVMVGALLRHGDPRQAMARAHEVLRRLDLYDKRSHDAGSLTLPDRKRLEVARALATEPKLLLLDEVMAGLRPTETDRMVEILKELNRGGLTILLIEHVMRAVMSLATRVLVLHHGAAIAEGLPAEVVREPAVVQSYLGAEAL